MVTQTMTPTFKQSFWASGWLLVVWHWGSAVAATAWALGAIGASWDVLKDRALLPNVLPIAFMSFLLGLQCAMVLGWFVFGPILYSQGITNGGPFVVGDQVQIIAGRYRGRIGRVYATWQHETVRVELDELAKKMYLDVFSAYQLLRVPECESWNGSPT